jgi:hypothetical protein
MNYKLFKNGIAVGMAAVLSEENVSYCLYETLRTTRYTTLNKLKYKYKLEPMK